MRSLRLNRLSRPAPVHPITQLLDVFHDIWSYHKEHNEHKEGRPSQGSVSQLAVRTICGSIHSADGTRLPTGSYLISSWQRSSCSLRLNRLLAFSLRWRILALVQHMPSPRHS